MEIVSEELGHERSLTSSIKQENDQLKALEVDY